MTAVAPRSLPAWDVQRDFLAAGDGSTDDTAAIQAAIDAAAAFRGALYIPAGVYVISSPLVLKYRVSLIGTGQTFHEAKDLSSLLRPTFKLANGAECNLLEMDPDAPIRGGQSIDHTYQHSYIEGLLFDGNKSNQTTKQKALLYCYRMWGLTLRNCAFDNAPGDGVFLDDVNAVQLYDCYVAEADRFGLQIKDSGDVVGSGLEIFGSAGPNLLLDNSWKNTIQGLFGNAVVGTETGASGYEHGIVLKNGSTSNVISGRADQNYLDGVYLDATSNSNSIDLCVLENGFNNASARAGFRIAGDDNHVKGTADYMPSATENQETGVVLEATALGNWVSVVVDPQHATTYDYSALTEAQAFAQVPSLAIDALLNRTSAIERQGGAFFAIQGSPALTAHATTRRVAWAFDAASDESIQTNFRVPEGWDQIKVTVLWTNLGAGSGDVRWSVQGKGFAVGDSLDVADNAVNVTDTAPAQNVLADFEAGGSNALPVTAGGMYSLRVKRVGTDGADTLANDAGVTNVFIEKV